MTNLLDARNISDLAKLQKELAQALEGEIKREEVALRVGREGLVVSLREVGFFDSGSAEVRLKSEPSVARIAKVLEAGPFYVRIEGHTDNVPIHTSRFPVKLGAFHCARNRDDQVVHCQVRVSPGKLICRWLWGVPPRGNQRDG